MRHVLEVTEPDSDWQVVRLPEAVVDARQNPDPK